MKLEGKVLRLTEDPALIRAQLMGEGADDLQRAPLRFGISTDLIINGAACTLGYSPEILGPHFLAGLDGQIGVGDIQSGGFEVLVAGDAYGSGSSREAAVVAHQGAGVKLVVARSLQRIFQENLVYAGLPFTTDFKVLDRLQAGEEVPLEACSSELPELFRTIVQEGGLLAYGRALLGGLTVIPSPADAQQKSMTCAQKIIAKRVYRGPSQPDGVPYVHPGEQLLCRAGFRGLHEYTAGMVMHIFKDGFGSAPIHSPEEVACFEDHFVLLDEDTVPLPVKNQRLGPARALTQEMLEACRAYGLRLHGPGRDAPAGVCHRIVLEEYARPGTVILLTDSHSPTAGVLNALGLGIGSTAMAFALRTGLIPITVPKSVRVEIEGDAQGLLSPKDVILHLIGDPWFREERWRTSPTDTCVVEFAGPGLEQWSVDELSVLTNMSVEGGLMSGVLNPTEAARGYIDSRRRNEGPWDWTQADDGAEYVRTLRLSLDDVPLTIATPGDSRNRASLSEHEGTAIHNVVIASCTGGSLADLRAAAQVLRGKRPREGTRLTVTPSSDQVARDAAAQGLLECFSAFGATVTPPGCGACIGNGPGVPLPGETTASTTNRNFSRRMGAPGPVYLVSPTVAAAAAVTGRLTDPRRL